MDNLDTFNEVTAQIFDVLLKSFPVPVGLDERSIAGEARTFVSFDITDEADDNFTITIERPVDPVATIATHARDWLSDEGFIRQSNRGYQTLDDPSCYVLTTLGLTALNSTPSSLKKPLRAQLADGLANTAKEARAAALGEFIGALTGAAARGFAGGAS